MIIVQPVHLQRFSLTFSHHFASFCNYYAHKILYLLSDCTTLKLCLYFTLHNCEIQFNNFELHNFVQTW